MCKYLLVDFLKCRLCKYLLGILKYIIDFIDYIYFIWGYLNLFLKYKLDILSNIVYLVEYIILLCYYSLCINI